MTDPLTDTLIEAAERGDTATVADALADGGNPDTRAETGLSLLMLAAGRGHTDLVAHLLDHGADATLLEPATGASALHLAAQGGHVEAADQLIDHGAHLNLQAASQGITPLMNAVWYRNPAMVGFLLEQDRINPNLRSTFGVTARSLASPEAVAPGTEDGDRDDPEDVARIRELFDEYEATMAETDTNEELFAAVVNEDDLDPEEQRVAVCELIDAGADVNYVSPVTGSGTDGHTPLLVAARDGLVGVVEELLAAGADMTITDEYMRATPIHKAAYMGHADVLEVLAAEPVFEEIVDVQGPYNGYTALHDATWHGHAAAVAVLVDAGAEVDIQGFDGNTPLDLTIEYEYSDIEELLQVNSERSK